MLKDERYLLKNYFYYHKLWDSVKLVSVRPMDKEITILILLLSSMGKIFTNLSSNIKTNLPVSHLNVKPLLKSVSKDLGTREDFTKIQVLIQTP